MRSLEDNSMSTERHHDHYQSEVVNPEFHKVLAADKPIVQQFTNVTEYTAKYPKQVAFSYLALGLFDELLELEEKHSRMWWEGIEYAVRRHEVKLEIGDVYWYAAELYRVVLATVRPDGFSGAISRALENIVVVNPDREKFYYHNFTTVYFRLRKMAGKLAGRAKKHLRDFDGLNATYDDSKIFQDAAEYLDEFIYNFVLLTVNLGYEVPDVLLAVSYKLFDRKERNVLSGDGDHR